jgi:pentatricopeptide repeat protein
MSENGRVFDEKLEFDDVIDFNAVTMGFVKYGEINESRKLFDNMPKELQLKFYD